MKKTERKDPKKMFQSEVLFSYDFSEGWLHGQFAAGLATCQAAVTRRVPLPDGSPTNLYLDFRRFFG